MPLCQGLPTGPCPADVNDRSVKITQGDLFLCRSCEEVRFSTNPNSSNKGITGKGGKSNSAAKRANQKQPDQRRTVQEVMYSVVPVTLVVKRLLTLRVFNATYVLIHFTSNAPALMNKPLIC